MDVCYIFHPKNFHSILNVGRTGFTGTRGKDGSRPQKPSFQLLERSETLKVCLLDFRNLSLRLLKPNFVYMKTFEMSSKTRSSHIRHLKVFSFSFLVESTRCINPKPKNSGTKYTDTHTNILKYVTTNPENIYTLCKT